MKKTIFALLVVLIVVGAVVLTLTKYPQIAEKPQDQLNQQITQTTPIHAVFASTTGETVDTLFYPDSVKFSTKDFGTITLPQAVSASGARYANETETWVFWNKGDDVTITHNGEIVFQGTDVSTLTDSVQPSAKLPAGSPSALTASSLSGTTWVWQKTVAADGTITTPKKSDAFSITFGGNNKLSATTDCNGFGGDYTIGSDGFIKFGSFMSTKMYCTGSQETVFSNAVSGSSQYTTDDQGNLILMNDNVGAIIFKKK